MSRPLRYQNEERFEIIFALREALDAKGLNFSSFAQKYGWDAKYVNLTAWKYWDTGKLPRGIIMRRILKKLQEEVAEDPVQSQEATTQGNGIETHGTA